MPRRLTLVASWLAATCAATLLVASGVGTIRDAARRDDALATPTDVGSTRLATTTTAAPATTSTTATAGTGPASGTTPTSIGADAPPATRPGTATSVPRPPDTTVATAPSTTTAAPPGTTVAVATTITIASTGGTVTVRSSATSVVVVVATPKPGFVSRIDQRGATAIRVEFESSTHKSRIEAWWEEGPRQDVREDS